MQYYIRCPDGSRYKVKEAISLKDALNEIAQARVTGSVGSKRTETKFIDGKPFAEWPVTVVADVHRVNSDNIEIQPC